MTAPINNYPYNNLENIMALSKSIRESSANVTSSCDLNTQDTVTLSDTTKLTEYKVPKPIKDNEEKISEYKVPKPIKDNGKKGIEEKVPEQTKDDGEKVKEEKVPEQIEDNGKKSDSDFNKSDIASSTVDFCRDALLEDIKAGTSGKTSNQGLLGKLQALAKKHPKIATFIKYSGKAAVPVINIASGISNGKKVAMEHSKGKAEHYLDIYSGAATGGIVGSFAGTAVGAAAGAVAGSAICPGVGTLVGLIVGFCASNYLSSKGAEIGIGVVEAQLPFLKARQAAIAEDMRKGMSWEDICKKYELHTGE